MTGCCRKVELVKELFDLFHEGDSGMDIIDLVIRVERVIYDLDG